MITTHLGFEPGTGTPVAVPLAHTGVTGAPQTGKTQTLAAIITRTHRPTIVFHTTPGDGIDGRPIPAFLPPLTGEPVPWHALETIVAAAPGEALRADLVWLKNAVRGAADFRDVRATLDRLTRRAEGREAEVYAVIAEALDTMLPDLEALDASRELDLVPGVNVMDLSTIGPVAQAWVLRETVREINTRRGVHVVVPDAAAFVPAGRTTLATRTLEDLARRGDERDNVLLLEAPDAAAVTMSVRQHCRVWVLHADPAARGLQLIRTRTPAPEDLATLGVGEVFVCATRVLQRAYVQPPWADAVGARAVALGQVTRDELAIPLDADVLASDDPEQVSVMLDRYLEFALRGAGGQAAIDALGFGSPLTEPTRMTDTERKIDRLIASLDELKRTLDQVAQRVNPAPTPDTPEAYAAALVQQLHPAMVPRLIAALQAAATPPAPELPVRTKAQAKIGRGRAR